MKTEQIFNLTAPYNNRYQGKYPRILFVCSVGMLRSATAATLASLRNINARCCGTDDVALIRLSVNLILWADTIVFVNSTNYQKALRDFEAIDYDMDINEKKIVWNIDDDYDYMDENLCRIINKYLDNMI